MSDAEKLGETLALIEPQALTLSWVAKSDRELENERRKHAELARQLSMLDAPCQPLDPCPYAFKFRWKARSGTTHEHVCDDWETSAAFFRRRADLGETAALQSLKQTYEVDYLQRGMRFALGTHSRRKTQWLLVGVLRVDEHKQAELPL